MKTRFHRWLKGLAILLSVPILSACYEEQTTATTTAAMTSAVSNAPVAPAAPVASAAPVISNVTNPAVVVATNATATNALPGGEVVLKKTFDPSTLNLSPGVADIVKMAQSGVSPSVMLEFINKAPHGFALTADEIVYLTDLGIPEDLIKAMLRKEGPVVAAQPEPAPAATNPPPQAATPPQPPPAQTAPEQPQTQQTAPDTTVVQQPVYVTQPQTVVTYQYFYDSLAPYGSWYYVSDYGYCWRPTVAVVNVGWRPYCHGGRWIYSTYGWYWQSDYTWGWAPFHYGRWYLHGSYGWLWVPDTVWGPSWVTWRYADGYCGWAPLPPGAHYAVGVGFTYHGSRVSVGFGFGLGHSHFTFVSARHFTSPHVHQYIASSQQAQTIYNNTTIINNYINGDNNTIVNRGIAREEIVRHTRADIPTLAVRDLPSNETGLLRPDRIAREGGREVVYRQTLPQVTATPAKGEGGAIKAPAPAVAVLNREQRAANVANLAGGGSHSPLPSEVTSGKLRTGPPTLTGQPSSGARRPENLEGGGQVLVSPRGRGARPPSPDALAPEKVEKPVPSVVERNRPSDGNRSTLPGTTYTPPRRDLSPTVPAAPVAPSAPYASPAKPSVPTYTPPSPSYTPPLRRETPSTPAAPSSPSYNPPSRREVTAPPAAPSTPSYTPPARREVTPTPTTPSYTPPTRRDTPPPASSPSYTPPTRSQTPSVPTTPSYTPPMRSENRVVTPQTPSPSYTPPARAETRAPAPINPPSYQRPANPPPTAAYNPPSRPTPVPGPTYAPPPRSVVPSAPSSPSYTPPARGSAPAYTPPSNSGNRGEPSRRSR